MSAQTKDPLPESPEELSRDPTAMALVRTRLAGIRTLMAWMRTAVSLIGFGFTIFKFFQYVEKSNLTDLDWNPNEPRLLGLALIALGLVFLLLGVVEYRGFVRRLGARLTDAWPTLLAATLLWAVGLVALASLLFHVKSG